MYSISYHRVLSNEMFMFEQLLYHTRLVPDVARPEDIFHPHYVTPDINRTLNFDPKHT